MASKMVVQIRKTSLVPVTNSYLWTDYYSIF